MDIITQYNLSLLIRLLVAHVISDFVLQTDSIVEKRYKKKWTSRWLYFHGIVSGSLAYFFSGYWQAIWLPILICISHIVIDGYKAQVENTAKNFILDQLGHFILIIIFWGFLSDVSFVSIFTLLIVLIDDIAIWIVSLGYLVIIWPVGFWIGKVTTPWKLAIGESPIQGLEKAGMWIGRLERVLIFTFVLVKQFEAIGFLIAAKSIFRFGEVSDPNNRKEAEYILIGTMISFTIAIIVGIFVKWILSRVEIVNFQALF